MDYLKKKLLWVPDREILVIQKNLLKKFNIKSERRSILREDMENVG